MGSRREEERNEKIIRGLMKLPPNRRCINCNSLGPQYACTNFWTFVCITCSGIHREFTHRVKSVSMSKFTSQEVESLQKGGNQRAREIYLKDWDAQRLRLPDSSNVDKVRTFIKNVYVDRKYAGGKTSDKPPRDMQSLRNHEDQTRRASSYHSYSQSPPYDYQYEDRRYGKQAAVLTRKPGSDRGLYEGKISSFLYSPGRFSDQMCEDRFANESSVSRVSDYSVSSGGDTFRSEAQSPNLQDTGISSPSNHRPEYISTELIQRQTLNTSSETKSGREAAGIPPPQITASLGSISSVDSNSVPLKSVNYGNSVDAVADVKQFSGVNQDTKSSFPTLPLSSVPYNPAGLDLLEAPFAPGPVSSASSADPFQPSEALSAQSVDFFQSPQISSAASMHLHRPPQNSSEISVPKNEGWATFDLPQSSASCLGNEIPTTGRTPSSDGNSLGNAHLGLSSNASMLQPSFQSSNAQGLSSTAFNPWHSDLHKVQDFTGASINSWNAFEDSTSYRSVGNNQQISYSQPASGPSLAADPLGFKVAEDPIKDVSQRDVVRGLPPDSQGGSFVAGSSYTQPDNTSMDGTQIHASEHKSTNPFDLPYDSEESSDLFLDLSSIQSALPASQLPPSFLGGVSEPWFPQNPATTYIPAAPQGGLGYIGGQTPASQLPSVPAQGSVASIGGNPFA